MRILEDTVKVRTDNDYPFVIGRYHEPVADKYNNPYFNGNEWVSGTLVYRGRTYSANDLKYDIQTDRLIYLMYNGYKMSTIALDVNLVSGFHIYNNTFRYFDSFDNSSGAGRKAGYYEVIYDGRLKFLVRWEKSKSLDVSSSSSFKYDVSDDMFLLKENKLERVKSMAGLIRLLKDRKKSMKKFVRSNHLRLNRSNYSSAAEVLKFYEDQ